jgi:peptidoglycan-N-acetylglucosamine deacetylase
MLRKFLTYFLLLFVTYARGQEIALTFDDAPMSNGQYFTGAKRTETLIKKLQQLKISQVAFFTTTSHIDSIGLKRLNQYAKAGHILANHSHSHQRSHVMGTAQYINDIHKADQILRTLPGFTPWYRFPFLDEGKTIATRDSLRQALAQMQYFNGYVTVDNYDWYINSLFQQALKSGKKVDLEALRKMYLTHLWNSIQFYDNMAKQTLGRSPKHVLLLHENDLAALFIDDLVQLLQQKGWKIISPTQAYTDPIATVIPNVLLNGQGRVAAIAKEKGYKGSFTQDSEDEAALEKQFAQLQIAR